jgi:hypothetical protein
MSLTAPTTSPVELDLTIAEARHGGGIDPLDLAAVHDVADRDVAGQTGQHLKVRRLRKVLRAARPLARGSGWCGKLAHPGISWFHNRFTVQP